MAHAGAEKNWTYSDRKLFTGLDSAALIDWKLTVNNVIDKAPMLAMTNTSHEMVIRYWYCASQLFIK